MMNGIKSAKVSQFTKPWFRKNKQIVHNFTKLGDEWESSTLSQSRLVPPG